MEREFSPNPDIQFAQNFIDSINSVVAYNNKHTGLNGSTRSNINAFEIHLGDTTVSHQDEADMEKELVHLTCIDQLSEMGITVFDTNAVIDEIEGTENKNRRPKTPTTLLMIITDGEKFGETLEQLNPSDSQKKDADGCINVLLGKSVDLIKSGYAPSKHLDESFMHAKRHVADTQLGIFSEINASLADKDYGQLPNVRKLNEYTFRQIYGTLEDYVGAELLGLLDKNTGPDSWQMESGAKDLETKWLEAFGYLFSLRDEKVREEPSAYYTELHAKLRKDFEYAQDWIYGRTDCVHRPNYSEMHIEPLIEAIEQLSHVWEAHFQLEQTYNAE